MRAFSRCFLVGVALVFGLSMVGCGGGGGGGEGGIGGGTTTTRLVAQSYDEQCSFCHSTGTFQDIADTTTVGMPHSIATGSPKVSIVAVREVNVGAGDDRLEVDFTIVDTSGALLPAVPAANIRFALARLDTLLPTSGGVPNWQSYINTTRTAGGVTYIRATTETATAGTLTDGLVSGTGTYTYRFSINMNNRTLPSPPTPPPGTAIPYDKAATHRIAMQVSGNVDNAFVDFVPNALPISKPPGFPAVAGNRKISADASCNQCHVRLGFHGGDRKTVEYCVTCHNPGSTDSASGNTVDFKVMIHKIHRGKYLPSVLANGSYILGGANYNTVVYPQYPTEPDGKGIQNCTKCHSNTPPNPSTPQGDNWKNVPTIEACGSCHDRTSFVDPPPAGFTLHTEGARDNTECADCHRTGEAAPVEVVHVIPQLDAATKPKFQYNILSITKTAPGDFPVVQFSVTNPSVAGNPAYNILTDPEFKAPGGASRLAVLISWDTKEYTNTGSRVTPAQPISINPLAGAVNDGANLFTVASTVPIPAGVTSGAVAIEGHPAVETVQGSGTYDLQVPVTGVVQSFPAGTLDRRAVVSVANCNRCHGWLSAHGNNRNNNPQLCVICHNANATDINRRPRSGLGKDGKAEELIDFKNMIHAIHAAKSGGGFYGYRTKGIVVYGFGFSVNDFSDVRMPTGSDASTLNRNLNIKNCLGCHIAGTFPLPYDEKTVPYTPTTISTGSDRADPNDDTNITPIASVCSSCHDDPDTQAHMMSNGGRFDYKAYVTVVEGGSGGGGTGTDQAATCGPGPVSSQPAGHPSRTDCCSCHSQR